MTFWWGVVTGLAIAIVLAFTPIGTALFQLRIFLAWARGRG